MSRCIQADQYDGSSTIVGSYATLEECEQNCNCVQFPACDDPENPGQFFCPSGCILDYYEFAPSNCICCNGIFECGCQDDNQCPWSVTCTYFINDGLVEFNVTSEEENCSEGNCESCCPPAPENGSFYSCNGVRLTCCGGNCCSSNENCVDGECVPV